jgi:hypothetical protein
MVGKRAEHVIEIRAYMKGRSLLGLKPKDIAAYNENDKT